MTPDDLEMVFVWRNHPEITQNMLTQHNISLEEHKQWYERASQSPSKHLLVYELEGTPMGFVSFTGKSIDRVADWGFYSAPNAPKGTGLKLGRAALNYAFDVIALHKVYGQVVVSNNASIKMHLKLGFRIQGVLREEHKVGDDYVRLVCFGILHNEWRSQLIE